MKKNLNVRNYLVCLIAVMLIIMSLPIAIAESPTIQSDEITAETITTQNETTTAEETTITSNNDLSAEPTTETQVESTSAQAVEIAANNSDEYYFPVENIDEELYKGILFGYDNGDGKLSIDEVNDVTWIGVNGIDYNVRSLRGIKLFPNLTTICVWDATVNDIDELMDVKNLTSLEIGNCNIEKLPDLRNKNITYIDLSENKLSYSEIANKLPVSLSDQFLEIARQQHPDPFKQTLTSNGINLTGMMLPDVNLSAMSKGENSFDVTVSRLEETYAPTNVALSFAIPEGKEITAVTYNGNSVKFDVVNDMIVFPFSGDGIYNYSMKDEETTTEPTTSETTTSEETTTEPTTEEPTTSETTTQVETTTVVETTKETTTNDNPNTGDNKDLSSVAIVAILSVFAMIFAIAFKSKKAKSK